MQGYFVINLLASFVRIVLIMLFLGRLKIYIETLCSFQWLTLPAQAGVEECFAATHVHEIVVRVAGVGVAR